MSSAESEAPPDRPPYRPSSRELLIWGILVTVILALTGAAMLRRVQRPPPPPLLVYAELPHFDLENRDGTRVTLGDLAGAPWIADFIFTRCPGICPVMTHEMSRVAAQLPAGDGVHLVSFSVDPEHDTAEVLQEYAERHDAPDSWYFLTGERQAIRSLSRDGFLLGVADVAPDDEAAATAGEAIEPIIHSNRFVLVDRAGRIRGYYDALEAGEVEELLRDLQTLLAEP